MFATEELKAAEFGLVETVCDALPLPVFIVDEDVCIYGYNLAARDSLGSKHHEVLSHRCGEVIRCVFAFANPEGCGMSRACEECAIRNSVRRVFEGKRAVRERHRIERVTDKGAVEDYYALVTASPLTLGDMSLALVLLEDINELVDLQRLIPICAVCKKVRTDGNYWQHVESYFSQHLDVRFSHGFCPDCYEKEVQKYRANANSFQAQNNQNGKQRQEGSLES